LFIGRERAFQLQPVILGVLAVMQDLGRAQQRLGRDAAPVRADAGEMLALDDCGPEAELRGPDCSDIAAGAGADDDDVVVSHGFSPAAQTSIAMGFSI
jgi:hypothetical protein